jgi:SEC-C motif-containing protein
MIPRDCPCFSGARYAQCCAPLHRGQRPAPSPEVLMRSRYAAFALGLGQYLVHTLAADHPDRARDEAVLARELSRAKERRRFLGLSVLGAHEEGTRGEVLFSARIFERGKDCSFTERSTFVLEQGHWRYADGEIVASPDQPLYVYKVCSAEEWAAATAEGTYGGSAVDARDGFIHFSTRGQLDETLRRHFAGQRDLVLVEVDPAAVAASLRWEPSRGGSLFPHLYGALPVALARRVSPIAAEADGIRSPGQR